MAKTATEYDRVLEGDWQAAVKVSAFNGIICLFSFLLLFIDRSENTINGVISVCAVAGILSAIMFLRYFIKALRS